MTKFAISFGKTLKDYQDPFETFGDKRPVYQELLDRIKDLGWEYFVVSTSTYKGNGVFEGYWDYSEKKGQPVITAFEKTPDFQPGDESNADNEVSSFAYISSSFRGNRGLQSVEDVIKRDEIRVDLVYDRSGGLKFPVKNDKLRVIDNYAFKKLAWDKWLAFNEIGEYMPNTFWVGEKNNLKKVLPKIKTDYVVLKPYNGLKGRGVFIGNKEDALDFEFVPGKPLYIAQEFVDTSAGIPTITSGKHDLRVVIINNKPVWSHIRIPVKGTLTANVARGGNLIEVDVDNLPSKVVDIVVKVAKVFYNKFDNPVYSLDFGFENGHPKIFEVNDQIGFPKTWMKAKDKFLEELVNNFKSKV